MLTFNLKKEWFEKIKSGEKTHEYREVKPYWTKRIENEIGKNEGWYWAFLIYQGKEVNKICFTECCFKCGYSKSTDMDKILYGKVKSIKIVNGKNTDLAIDKDVYDIEFELIK